jgi:hypothetical protein
MTLQDAIKHFVMTHPETVINIRDIEDMVHERFNSDANDSCTIELFGADYVVTPELLHCIDPSLARAVWSDYVEYELNEILYKYEPPRDAVHSLMQQMDTIKELVGDDAAEDPDIIDLIADPAATLEALLIEAFQDDTVIRACMRYVDDHIRAPF